MVEPFETKPGVISVLSGYTGGETKKPNYDQVSGGYTGHVEAVEIIFDTRQITYEELLEGDFIGKFQTLQMPLVNFKIGGNNIVQFYLLLMKSKGNWLKNQENN